MHHPGAALPTSTKPASKKLPVFTSPRFTAS